MKIYGFFICIIIIYLSISEEVSGKFLFKRSSCDRDDEVSDSNDQNSQQYNHSPSVKRQQEQYEELESGLRKGSKGNSVGYDTTENKRSIDLDEAREEPLDMYNYKRNQKRSPYGVVYNEGQPIGILEPIYQSYQFKNIDDQHSFSKRETDNSLSAMERLDDESDLRRSALRSGKYAAVLASFKIDNKLKTDPVNDDAEISIEKRIEKNRVTKRDPTSEEHTVAVGTAPAKDLSKPANFVPAKSTSKAKREALDLGQIERNIMGVMDEMGLIDPEKIPIKKRESKYNKRDSYNEDEDLENGLNRIGMTKDTHAERNKKENTCPKVKSAKNKKASIEGTEEYKREVKHRLNKRNSIANYQAAGESYIREKRQNSDDAEAIMKGLETSGDLTVSGNKSPLATSVNADQNDTENKRTAPDPQKSQNSTDLHKRDRENDEYEKRLERNIQNKITAIKTAVKREIGAINEEKAINVVDTQVRSKRDVTNLLDEENSTNKILDPQLNSDEGQSPLVRGRRRSESVSGEDENSSDDEEIEASDQLDKRQAQNLSADSDYAKQKRTIDININAALDGDEALNDFDGFNEDETVLDITKRSEDAKPVTNVVGNQPTSAGIAQPPPPPPSQSNPGAQPPAVAAIVGGSQSPGIVGLAQPPAPAPPVGASAAVAGVAQPPPPAAQLGPGVQPPSVVAPGGSAIAPIAAVGAVAPLTAGGGQPPSANIAMQPAPPPPPPAMAAVAAASVGSAAIASPAHAMTSPLADGNNTLAAVHPGGGNAATAIHVKQQRHLNATDSDPHSRLFLRRNDLEESEDYPQQKYEEARSAEPAESSDNDCNSRNSANDGDDTADSTSDRVAKRLLDKNSSAARPERFLQNNISEEEFRNMENENPSWEQRKRRQVGEYYNLGDDKDGNDDDYDRDIVPKRAKRGELPRQIFDRSYDRLQNDEDDREEFEDSYKPQKRAIVGFNFDEDPMDDEDIQKDQPDNIETEAQKNKRQAANTLNLNNENYQNPYLDDLSDDQYDAIPNYYPNSEDYRRRRRRQAFDSSGLVRSSLHGGGGTLAAATKRKERMQSSQRNFRKKRNKAATHKSAKDINMEALAGSELFGGLPQSFEGELSRFKRVKRDAHV